MVHPDVGEVTRRLQSWSYGDQAALNDLSTLTQLDEFDHYWRQEHATVI